MAKKKMSLKEILLKISELSRQLDPCIPHNVYLALDFQRNEYLKMIGDRCGHILYKPVLDPGSEYAWTPLWCAVCGDTSAELDKEFDGVLHAPPKGQLSYVELAMRGEYTGQV